VSRLLVGPFNRVEGDLEVQLEVSDGQVREAWVRAPMYRGFEAMLLGRDALDALVIAPRICGICSVAQSVAAAAALADAAGVQAPPNGVHAINLMLACENLADHLSHFYLFFMPDFTRPGNAGRPWFAQAQRRFAALSGEHVRGAIAARRRWLELMGTLGGKWPHTRGVAPGGSARAITATERIRLLTHVRELRDFLQHTLFGAPLEEVGALASEDALQVWQAADPLRGDLRLFLTIAADCGLASLGVGPGLTLSYGAYPQPDGAPALAAGVWDLAAQRLQTVDAAAIAEDASHAWLTDGPNGALHPRDGLTHPAPDKPGGYTWNKAPRLAGRVVETGAIARQLASAQPLVRDVVARHGATVYTRVLARLVELAVVLPMTERWFAALVPGEAFHAPDPLPRDAEGSGRIEAARGALGHWLKLRDGRIAGYQIIAPTSWNFSPRDAAGTPGALEQALVGAPVADGEPTPVAVQHIVRSFDPCMVCTVH
jgi:Ni,Fe-hydrogenase I large subunit